MVEAYDTGSLLPFAREEQWTSTRRELSKLLVRGRTNQSRDLNMRIAWPMEETFWRVLAMVNNRQNYSVSGLCPTSSIVQMRETTFRKLNLFLSSGDGAYTYSVDSLRKNWHQALHNPYQIQVILQPTVCRPVRLIAGPPFDKYFLSSRCRAPSPISPWGGCSSPKSKLV
jgi:hypothetical protein